MKPQYGLTLAICILLLSACGPGGVSAHEAWARPAPLGEISAAYLVLQNTGPADALIGVSTDVAGVAEMHENVRLGAEGDALMMMSPVERIALPSGGEVVLEPGGYHVMLFDLQRELVVGEYFTLLLQFEHAGTVHVEVSIENR